MEPHIVLLQLVIILLLARLGGEAASYLKVPSVLGEILAGVILGPSLLGWVEMTPILALLSEIGVILLLFEVGIETDISKLMASGGRAVLVALGGIAIPFGLGFFICSSLFGLPFLVSLFVGCTLTATSIGITLRVLRDLKKQDTTESQIVLGAAILDDILGMVLLSMLYEFASQGEVKLLATGKVLLFIALFLCLSPIVIKAIAYLLQRWKEKSSIPGLLPAMVISVLLLFASLAHALGAPTLLGGFAAGLALSKKFSIFPALRQSREFSRQIEEQLTPIVHLFAPIFFVSIGLSLDLRQVTWSSVFVWQLTALLLAAALIGKFVSGLLLWQEKRKKQFLIGIAMMPRGEIGLVFASVGLSVGSLSQDLYTALILVVMGTTLIAPLLLRRLYVAK